jgi:hypothetical protein
MESNMSMLRSLMSTVTEPVPFPIKGFAQGEYRRQFDLMPNGQQFVMLFLVVRMPR